MKIPVMCLFLILSSLCAKARDKTSFSKTGCDQAAMAADHYENWGDQSKFPTLESIVRNMRSRKNYGLDPTLSKNEHFENLRHLKSKLIGFVIELAENLEKKDLKSNLRPYEKVKEFRKLFSRVQIYILFLNKQFSQNNVHNVMEPLNLIHFQKTAEEIIGNILSNTNAQNDLIIWANAFEFEMTKFVQAQY